MIVMAACWIKMARIRREDLSAWLSYLYFKFHCLERWAIADISIWGRVGCGGGFKKCVILILLFFDCFYFLMTKALAKPNQHLVKDKHLLEKLGRDQNSGPHFWRQTHNQRSKKLKKEKWKFIWLPKLCIYGKGIWFYGNIPFVGGSNLEVNLAGKWLVLQESARLCLKHEKVKRGIGKAGRLHPPPLTSDQTRVCEGQRLRCQILRLRSQMSHLALILDTGAQIIIRMIRNNSNLY